MPEKKIHYTAQVYGRIVTGPLGDVGYMVKHPEGARKTEALQQRRYAARQEELDRTKIFKRTARLEHFHKWCAGSELKSIRAAANRLVDLGMKQAEDELNWRRNKLRKLLLIEESKHIEECTDKAQKASEVRHEKEKNMVEEILRKKTDTDAICGREIIEREILLKSDEFKDKLRSENTKTLHDTIKEQVCEKEKTRLEDEEIEKMWKAIAAETDRKDLKDLERAEETKCENQRNYLEALQRQVEAKKRQLTNEACVESIEQQMIDKIVEGNNHQYDLRESEARRQKLLHDQYLLRQIEENRLIAARKKEEEMKIDQLLIEDDMRKKAAEVAAIRDNRRQAWSELVIFKEAINQYKNAFSREEATFETETNKLRDEHDAKQELEQRQRESTRKLLNKQAADHRKMMIAEKTARNAELQAFEEKRGALKRYRCAQQDQLDQACQHYPLKEVNTIPYLDKQVEYSRVLEQRQLQEDWETLEKMRKDKEDVLQRLLKNETVTTASATHFHPFYRVLRNPR